MIRAIWEAANVAGGAAAVRRLGWPLRRQVGVRLGVVLCIASLAAHALPAEITIDSITMTPSSTASLNVYWSSTIPLNYLTTEFRITQGAGGVAEQLVFATTAGEPPMPPLAHSNYVFYNDSYDLIQFPSDNPAVVAPAGAWDDATYTFADSTESFFDYPQDGNRLWTTLEVSSAGLAAGVYEIVLQSGQYTNGDDPNGLTPTASGGIITIVPEPAFWPLGAACIGGVAWRLSRRRRGLELIEGEGGHGDGMP